jgi:hypothetical protein
MKYIKLLAVLLSVSLAACTGSGASYMAVSGSTAYSSTSGKSPLIRMTGSTSQIPSVADAVTNNSNFQFSSSSFSLNSQASSATGESTTSGIAGTSSGSMTPAGLTPADTSSRPAVQTTSSTASTKPSTQTNSTAPTNSTKPTNSTPSPSQTTSTKPNDPPAPPPASSAAPKTAYDKPYDINQIRADMIAYGQSKGMVLESSFYVQNVPPDYPSNAGYQFPSDTRYDFSTAAQFKKDCRDSIDGLIAFAQASEPNVKPSDIRFNVVLLPFQDDPGNYFVFVLYG